MLVARKKNLSGFLTDLTSRSKNLHPIGPGKPSDRSTRPVFMSDRYAYRSKFRNMQQKFRNLDAATVLIVFKAFILYFQFEHVHRRLYRFDAVSLFLTLLLFVLIWGYFIVKK